MVVEVKQPVYRRFRYPEPACQFHFSEAGCLKRRVQLRLRRIQSGQVNHPISPATGFAWPRDLFALSDVLMDHGADRVGGHLAGFFFGVALGNAPSEVGKCYNKTAFLGGLEQRGIFHAMLSPLN